MDYFSELPEECVIIESYPDYAVSSSGCVYTRRNRGRKRERSPDRKWRKLSPSYDRDGYVRIVLTKNDGPQKASRVHHLVLEAFGFHRPEGMECRHLNGIRDDNRLENLKWDTHKENCKDKKRHGTHKEMCSHPMAKLKEIDVKAIRCLSGSGFTFKYIASIFGVSKSNVRSIVSRNTWAKVL